MPWRQAGRGDRQAVRSQQEDVAIGEVLVVELAQDAVQHGDVHAAILREMGQHRRKAGQHGVHLDEGPVDRGLRCQADAFHRLPRGRDLRFPRPIDDQERCRGLGEKQHDGADEDGAAQEEGVVHRQSRRALTPSVGAR